MHGPALDSAASVVVASERLDGESGWRMLQPGELLHVRPDLSVESAVVLPDPPARLVPPRPRQPEHRHLTAGNGGPHRTAPASFLDY